MKGILVALAVAVALGAWLLLRKPDTTVAGGAGPAAVVPAATAQASQPGPTGSGITPASQLPTGAQSTLPPAGPTVVPIQQPAAAPLAPGPLAESK